jgi:hypothetical protein
MALSFPRDFPNVASPTRFTDVSFTPMFNQVRAPTRGGLVQVAEIGPALWQMSFQTRLLPEAEFEEWRAWLSSLRGGQRTFRAFDPLRRFARAYPGGYGALTRAGGGSFSAGTATLSAIATARDEITITTLPASFALSLGDMISIPFASSRSLHRVVEAATASAGGSATVGVEPILPLAITTGATIDLARPWCLAVIDADSVTETRDLNRLGAVSFKAMQSY